MSAEALKALKAARHEYESARGLHCIDRHPSDVSKEWIVKNSFELELDNDIDFDIIEAAIKSPPVADKWLPISTAPRDGTHLQFVMNGEAWFGKWYENATYPKLSRWKIFGSKEWADQPTHWMQIPPLPEPPVAGGV